MRIIKEYDERKNEILNAAEGLFYRKGYEKCTINDILREVAIAKGTFYYYFKSKEEVLDGVISRNKEIIISRVEKVLKQEDLDPAGKLMNAFLAMRIDDKIDRDKLEELHKPENALFHQKILSQMVSSMAPILVKIIEEGMEKKVWNCKYPLEYMQIFMSAALTLTDEGIFEMNANTQKKLMVALISMLETLLEVPEGFLLQLSMSKW